MGANRNGRGRLIPIALVLALVAATPAFSASPQGELLPGWLWQNYTDMPDQAIGAWLGYITANPGHLWLPSLDVLSPVLEVWGYTGDFEQVQLYAEIVIPTPQTEEEYDQLVQLLQETLDGKTPQEANFSPWDARLWVLSYQNADGKNIGFCQWRASRADEFHCYLFTSEGNVEVSWQELEGRRGE